MAITDPTHRAPGRPRSAAADRRIVEATLRLLSRDGYDRTSIEAVAAEARVTRGSVYRRYATKAEMVTAAVCTMSAVAEAGACAGTRATLTALLEDFRRCIEPHDGVSIVSSLYLQRHDHPEMLESFRERIITPARHRLAAVLELARERGEVRPDVDPEAAVEMMVGAYLYRTFAGLPTGPDWPERVVAAAWPGLAA
jgi:AcrR family transcriptional regulator